MFEALSTRDIWSIELDQLVELTHRSLGIDLVFVSELTDRGAIFRALAGDMASFNLSADGAHAGQSAYAELLLAGEIPNVIRDTSADHRVADLPVTREARIGSFIGVPLRLSDGTVYGTFCCVSHEPDPALGDRDVHFMSMLAELVVHDLDQRNAKQHLRADILGLIEGETVNVAYQPIFDLRRKRCLGVEALARFPEPFSRPDQTFALAEQIGLGLELEELVVRQAWTVLSQLGEGQFLALNLTPASLLQLARRANQREEVPLSALVVEITEHTAVDRYAELRHELERLRARGLRIAVDDAGAGYASLRHVLELRPDIIKIDRSLIHGIAEDRVRQIAVSGFVSMAEDMGCLLVAEGVELSADLDTVRELGLHAAQGYLLSRPSTNPDALASWIAHQPPRNPLPAVNRSGRRRIPAPA